MRAEELINQGNLAETLKALQDSVRKDPSNAKLRVFLFQLLAVMGNWSRALTQLGVCAELDASTVPMMQTYREALQCEALRSQIFAGKRPPLIFGNPQSWSVMLLEALRLDAEGQFAKADALRAQALEEAPTTSGSINGSPFVWLADADTRLGPTLEAVVNGRYYWIPFNRVKQIEIDAPVDLRDVAWMPATLTWVNGGQAVALIPTRYNGTEQSTDNKLLLARATEWRDVAGSSTPHGIGQRMLITDEADFALMDVREILLDSVADAEEEDDAQAATGEEAQAAGSDANHG